MYQQTKLHIVTGRRKDKLKISKIKELFFQHFRASKKSVVHRTPRTLQRVKKAIKYFWDLQEDNARIRGVPNESNLDEIYINIKSVFLARYKKSIDSNTVNDDLMKKECKYINAVSYTHLPLPPILRV